MKFTDVDYFQIESGEIFIVKGSVHPKGKVLACPVYWPSQTGDRISSDGGRYIKKIEELRSQGSNKNFIGSQAVPREIVLVPTEIISRYWKPRSAIKRFKREFQNTVWFKIFQSIINSGVPENDVGIFGSYLVGLHSNGENLVKDIDFVVYGEKNCQKIKRKMPEILVATGLKKISSNHIKYEAQKLGGNFGAENNTFEKTLANKWSSVQVSRGVLTTLRFVKFPKEEVDFGLTDNPIIDEKVIKGVVINDFGTNFIPRSFQIFDGEKIWKVVTFFWVFHQAVKNGELVEISGNCHQYGNMISIDKYNQGIKIIGEKNEILLGEQGNLHQIEIGRGRAISVT